MGKKGRHSYGREEGLGKGFGQAQLKDIHSSVEYARKMAYDHQAIQAKQTEMARSQRRKLVFPHLDFLLNQRSRDDAAYAPVQGTSYDRSWEQYFRRQGATDQRMASAEKTIKNMKKRFYLCLTPVHNDRLVSSLSNICVQVIAKNLPCFDPLDVQFALSTVSHQKTEQLSLLSSITETLTDEYAACLHNDLLERVVLSKNITDTGLTHFLSAMQHTTNSHFKNLDSWESIDLSELNIHTCLNLCSITFLSSKITSASLTLLTDHCPQLQSLCLHDVQFATEAHKADPTVFCLQLLDILRSGYASLVSLEVHYCHWMRIQSLHMWARQIDHLRRASSNKETLGLQRLRNLTITGVEDFLMEQSGNGMSGTNGTHGTEDALMDHEPPWDPVHPLFQTIYVPVDHSLVEKRRTEATISRLKDFFASKCNVSLSVEM